MNCVNTATAITRHSYICTMLMTHQTNILYIIEDIACQCNLMKKNAFSTTATTNDKSWAREYKTQPVISDRCLFLSGDYEGGVDACPSRFLRIRPTAEQILDRAKKKKKRIRELGTVSEKISLLPCLLSCTLTASKQGCVNQHNCIFLWGLHRLTSVFSVYKIGWMM